MDRRAVAVMAVAPFVTLAGVLKQLPVTGPGISTWGQAGFHTALFLLVLGTHAWLSARWQPHAPNRMLVNEFLARLLLALSGLIFVGLRSDYGGLYLVMASAWAVASWCTHYLVLRRQERYDAVANLALLGLFLLGIALMAMVCIKLAVADAA